MDRSDQKICRNLEEKMTHNTHYKRRNYFINKEFQGRYIFNYFVLAAIGSLLFIGVFSFFSSNTLPIVYDNYHLQLGVTPEILFKKMLSTQWLFIVVGGGIVVLVTLLMTHRVAGPFYRFEKTLDRMVDGDLTGKIVLRKKDEGKELAQKINAFNFMLSEKLVMIEQFNGDIDAASMKLKRFLEKADPAVDDCLLLLDEILDSQQNIQTMINDYHFSREKL